MATYKFTMSWENHQDIEVEAENETEARTKVANKEYEQDGDSYPGDTINLEFLGIKEEEFPQKIYRTTYKYVVLSKEPIPEGMELQEVIDASNNSQQNYIAEETLGWESEEELEGEDAVKAIYEFGSEPGFFSLDEKGYQEK